jgi:hypothetical protein
MNEKASKPTRVKSKTPPKKGKAGLFVIIALVVVVGACIAIVTLDLFNFREGAVMTYLRNAPLIGNLFPAVTETDIEDIPLEEWPVELLTARVRELEALVARQEAQINEQLAQTQADALRIARLLPFYENWMEYQRVSAEFNAMIAHGDPEAYLRFVSNILPEFYEQLARESMLLYQYQEAVRITVSTLRNMQERDAARFLEDMRLDDLPFLTAVLLSMSDSMRGGIFEQMETEVGSFMFRLIAVAEPVFRPLAPALFTPTLPEVYEDLYELEPEEEEIED